MRNVFEKLDTDGTGSVSIDQLMKTLKESKDISEKTAETLSQIDLKGFDLDGDGQIDWQVKARAAPTCCCLACLRACEGRAREDDAG